MASSTLIGALRLTMLAALLCWICIWVLRPTKFWKKSWHSAEDASRNTILGDYGLDVVVFCFPLLLLAILGYLHQHLLQSRRTLRGQSRRLPWINLSSPVIVRSPVGILSVGELLAASVFASLLVWTLYSYLSNDFRKLLLKKSLHTINLQQLRLKRVGVRFGSLSEICLAVLFLPVLRGMALFRTIGVQFEASVRYHVWIGNSMILFSVIHGVLVAFTWTDSSSFWTEITKWQRTGRVYPAGAIALLAGLAIWVTSLPVVRRKKFQFFFAAHHLYVIFITFYLFHCGDRHFYLVLPGVLLFALDKVLRALQSKPAVCLISASLLPCKAIELTLSKHPNVEYNPTSVLFVNVPSISKLHWHPFSVITSKDVDRDRMSMIIKCRGWWTKALYDRIHRAIASGDESSQLLQFAVEGPYGPSENLIRRYDSLILVAGGSGITPLLSIATEAASQRTASKIHLIYSVKKLEDLSMLSPISPLLLNQQPAAAGCSQLKLKAFVTRGHNNGTPPMRLLKDVLGMRTSSLRPPPPMGFASCPDGLLWKATIAGASSTIFLLVLVVLNRIFLPTDRTSSDGGNYPSWISDIIVATSLLVAVMATAVGTFTKRKFSREDMDVIDPPAKSNGRSDEASPAAEEHEVYFGKRPNLAELLEELAVQMGKSKVGVFVCGPESVEESVARFCRAKSAIFSKNTKIEGPNFGFHSLSFSL